MASLYEFTFIVQQALLQHEVEELIHELALLLKSIKNDFLSRDVKILLEEEGSDRFVETSNSEFSKEIKEFLPVCSNFLEDFNKVLWIELESDLSNLKEIIYKVDKDFGAVLKGLEFLQNFTEIIFINTKIPKHVFIRNSVIAFKGRVLRRLTCLLQEVVSMTSKSMSQTWLKKILGDILENVCAAGLIKYEYWGMMDFAYLINRMKGGHYFMMCISSTSDIVSEFVRRVKINENIVRYLHVRVDRFFEGKSHMVDKEISEQVV